MWLRLLIHNKLHNNVSKILIVHCSEKFRLDQDCQIFRYNTQSSFLISPGKGIGRLEEILIWFKFIRLWPKSDVERINEVLMERS